MPSNGAARRLATESPAEEERGRQGDHYTHCEQYVFMEVETVRHKTEQTGKDET